MDNLKRKRVMYPWIKTKQGKLFKCYLAIVSDNLNWGYMLKGKGSVKKVFLKRAYPKLIATFPKMYLSVKRHYEDRGRTLTEKEFQNLVFMRFKCLYVWNGKTTKKSVEHPLHKQEKNIKKYYSTAMKLHDKGGVFVPKRKKK